MQTTLLGAAIAIILALVTALVGPLLVDWGRFRDTFEARANRLTGLEVRFAGPIEVHILPTPTLKLQAIGIRRPGEVAPTRARSVQIEFALDALMRGSLRAANVTVDEPELAFGLDRSGRFDWLAPTIGFDPDAVSIDHLAVEHGHVVLSDAASGASVTLEKVAFAGTCVPWPAPPRVTARSCSADEAIPTGLSTGRPGADGAVKLRLPSTPRTAAHGRARRFDLARARRPAVRRHRAMGPRLGRSSPGTGEPWRVTSHARRQHGRRHGGGEDRSCNTAPRSRPCGFTAMPI